MHQRFDCAILENSISSRAGEEVSYSNKASVIIVTYNHRKYIKDCLASVLASNPLEVIVVDNSSTDRTAELIEREFPQVRLIKSKRNLGYGGGNNLGVRNAKGEYVVILKPYTDRRTAIFKYRRINQVVRT